MMTLYEQIYHQIKTKIMNGEFDIDKPLPTEAALQKEYNVSRITAKQAYAKLSEEGFVERHAGKGTFIRKNFRHGKHPLIGLVLCDFDSTFGERLIKQIEISAAESGYSIILKRSLDDHKTEDKAIKELMDVGVSGIIIQNCHGEYTKNLMGLTVMDFPIVSVDRYAKGLFIPSVTSDNFNSSMNATESLISAGHKHLLFASSDTENTSTLTERRDGFKEAHLKNGLPLSPHNLLTDLISPLSKKEEDIERDIIKIQEALCSSDITGIIASERFVAELCSIAAKRLNKHFPDDIELICFDCSERVLSTREFTYIRQNESELAKVAVKQLIYQINGETQKQSMRSLVPAAFIKGNSTF